MPFVKENNSKNKLLTHRSVVLFHLSEKKKNNSVYIKSLESRRTSLVVFVSKERHCRRRSDYVTKMRWECWCLVGPRSSVGGKAIYTL